MMMYHMAAQMDRQIDGVISENEKLSDALRALVLRCEQEMCDTIDIPEIQEAKALLGMGA